MTFKLWVTRSQINNAWYPVTYILSENLNHFCLVFISCPSQIQIKGWMHEKILSENSFDIAASLKSHILHCHFQFALGHSWLIPRYISKQSIKSCYQCIILISILFKFEGKITQRLPKFLNGDSQFSIKLPNFYYLLDTYMWWFMIQSLNGRDGNSIQLAKLNVCMFPSIFCKNDKISLDIQFEGWTVSFNIWRIKFRKTYETM